MAVAALALALVTAQYVLATPPDASFTAPSVLQIGESGTFTSTTPNPDGDGDTITTTEWDFDDNGSFDAQGASVSHSYSTAGTRTVRMRVTDSAMEISETTRSVRVNRVPTASFTATPSSAGIGQNVTFNGSASSDDTTITKYEWDLDGNGSFETNSGGSASTSTSYPSPGTRQVKLRVTDADGAVSGVATQDVTVSNTNPIASFTASPNPALANQTVTFNGSASSDPDPGGSITKYEWDLDGDGSFERDTGGTATTTYAHPTPGSRTVKLRVTDNNGATDVDAKTVSVNVPPTASFTATPSAQVVGQPVNFDGSGSRDNDGTIAQYQWDLDGNGSFERSTTAATTSFTYPSAGTRSVGLRVVDNSGGQSSPVTRNVVIHNPPTASFTAKGPVDSRNPDVPETNEPVTFDAAGSSANDPGGSIVKYEWDLDSNNSFETNQGADPLASRTFSTGGTRTIRLRVTDDQGATAEIAKAVRINVPPVANVNVLNDAREPGQLNTTPLETQTFALYAGAVPAINGVSPRPGCAPGPGSPAGAGSTDAEGALANYEFDVDNNGLFETDPAGTTDAAAVGPFPAGSRTVRLRVTDSDGAQTVATRTFQINAAPDPRFVLEPLTPIVDQLTTFSSTSTDRESADAQLTYSWDLDNDGVWCEPADLPRTPERGQSVKHTFPTANTNPGHPVKLAVTDTGGITREVARNVIVQNTIPKAGFTWAPNSPLPGQSLTLNGSPSAATAGKQIQSYQWDLDFDTRTSQFDVDAQGVSATTSFATPGTKTVALKVTETGGGFAIVFDRIVVNAPPQASFSIAPGSPLTGDQVTFSSTAADPDGPLAAQDWDLDADGQFDDASGEVATRTYATAGTYNVALRVTDSKGVTQVASGEVKVAGRPLPPPPPPPRVLPGVAIQIAGRVLPTGARVTMLRVRAPKGSKVTIRCSGKRCPKRKVTRTVRGKALRFKVFERRLRAGIKITVVVSQDGFISRYTRFTIRRGKPPSRADRCIPPGTSEPTACPAS